MRRKNFLNLFYFGNNYNEEFRKQIRMFIIFTFGFTIAFSWRETFFDISKSFIHWTFGTKKINSLSILASIFITFVCVLLILLTTHYFKERH